MKNYCKSKLFTIIVLLHNYFSMNFFKGRLTNRLALSKFIGFLFWGLAFFAIPYVFIHADILLRFGIWFWYISIWAVIGVFGVMDRFPIWNMRFPALLRWACLGAWMNFVLIFFIHDKITLLMLGTYFEWFSPIWLVLEWLLFGILADYFATKYVWEGKKLLEV